MTGPFRILCAVDASLPAAAAFEQALALSVQRGAQLVLVHAVPKHTAYSWGAVERVALLAALRARAEVSKVPVRVRTQQGDTAEVVLLHARAHAPDLIVLGSHEPIGLARFRFGSIADRVVRGATCPVLLVPAAIAQATPSFRRVVCAVDLSARTPAMIGDVSRFLQGVERFVLLHVVHDSAQRRAASGDARQRLRSMLDTQNVQADVIVTASSRSVDDDILRVASETTADLIVLGVTRSTGLRRRLLGSTAIRASRRSPIPVLILPVVHARRTLSPLDQAALGWAA